MYVPGFLEAAVTKSTSSFPVVRVTEPRQYGRSTWLESELCRTITAYGPDSAYYLNGDETTDADALVARIRELMGMFDRRRKVRRLFVDEMTAVREWQRGLRKLADEGALRDVFVVTTGSQALDLRRGAERLPGRKGRLARTGSRFTPVSFAVRPHVRGGLSRLGPRAPNRGTAKALHVSLHESAGGIVLEPVSNADRRAIPRASTRGTADLLEWMVAQELFRRRCISGEEVPEQLLFWQSKDHELDFLVEPGCCLEVKRGPTKPMEFSWFEQTIRGARLTVVGDTGWRARSISGTTFEELLRAG